MSAVMLRGLPDRYDDNAAPEALRNRSVCILKDSPDACEDNEGTTSCAGSVRERRLPVLPAEYV